MLLENNKTKCRVIVNNVLSPCLRGTSEAEGGKNNVNLKKNVICTIQNLQ